MACVTVGGKFIPVRFGPHCTYPYGQVTKAIKDEVLSAPAFLRWVGNLDPLLSLVSLSIQSVDIFCRGTPQERIGFIKLVAETRDEEGTARLSTVLLRGASVAALIILSCEGEDYLLLTKQAREPVGQSALIEMVAGSMDNSTNFFAKLLGELKEETGMDFAPEEVIDMMALIGSDHPGTFYLSPGTMDEEMKFFLVRRTVSQRELQELTTRVCGLAEEGECIRLVPQPMLEARMTTRDGKLLIAIERYLFLKERGFI
ncbi:MAG: hypothetical protein ACAH35_05270 [Candidatus Paceibacterota bacterium]